MEVDLVAKYMGDGVSATSAIRKREHDAERAVRAGLAIVEAAPTLQTAAGVPLHVRVPATCEAQTFICWQCPPQLARAGVPVTRPAAISAGVIEIERLMAEQPRI